MNTGGIGGSKRRDEKRTQVRNAENRVGREAEREREREPDESNECEGERNRISKRTPKTQMKKCKRGARRRVIEGRGKDEGWKERKRAMYAANATEATSHTTIQPTGQPTRRASR